MPLRLVNDFLVGCDPEFIVLDGTTVKECPIAYTCDDGAVGNDHGEAVVELRPTPAKGSYTVINRLKKLMSAEPVKAKLVGKWRSGPAPTVTWEERPCGCGNPECDGGNDTEEGIQPLGGHIHLGIKPDVENWYEITQALDAHTRLLEHLDILPQKECEARREDSEFGEYGEVVVNGPEMGRWDKYDYDNRMCEGNDTDPDAHMEYRTPPSWLYHPKVAMLCLTGSKLAAVDPKHAIESLDKATHLNSLRAWYDSFKGKDVNADRVSERILHGARVEHLRFDPDGDIRERWSKLGF